MEKKKHKSRKRARGVSPIPIRLLKGDANPFESEVDPVKVADLTDRVFRSVLGKYGWGQNEDGRIEHIGAGESPESRARS